MCANGEAKLVSLRTAFDASGKIIDLNVGPLERISLMRLLICIAHASTGGVGGDFEQVRKDVANSVEGYLDKWSDRFNLFDKERPFLQQANIEYAKEPKKLSTMDFYSPDGSYNKFFNSNIEDLVSPGNLALRLLTYQNFAPSGLCGMVFWNGKPTSKTPQGSCGDAVCTAQNAVRTYVLKNDLFSSVCANLVPRESIENGVDVQKMEFGKPCWEVDLIDQNTPAESVRNNTDTFLGRLVPISRAIKIFNEGKYLGVGDGLKYKSFPDILDFECSFRLNAKGDLYVLRCSQEKEIWRSLHAILAQEKHGASARPPWAINQIAGESVKIWAGGIITNQAKIETSIESFFQIPETINSANYQRAVLKYGELVKAADNACAALDAAVEDYKKSMKIDAKLKDKARSIYWNKLTQSQGVLMELFSDSKNSSVEESPFANTERKWERSIARAQNSAIESALPSQSSRQKCAIANAKKKLFKTKKGKKND